MEGDDGVKRANRGTCGAARQHPRAGAEGGGVEGDEGVDELMEVLAVLRNDIATLWADAALRALVTAARTEDCPGLIAWGGQLSVRSACSAQGVHPVGVAYRARAGYPSDWVNACVGEEAQARACSTVATIPWRCMGGYKLLSIEPSVGIDSVHFGASRPHRGHTRAWDGCIADTVVLVYQRGALLLAAISHTAWQYVDGQALGCFNLGGVTRCYSEGMWGCLLVWGDASGTREMTRAHESCGTQEVLFTPENCVKSQSQHPENSRYMWDAQRTSKHSIPWPSNA
ncbi:hypothetical protein DFH08DRAFT_818777 [Mycena albidolilacea]|uniref:Uncharacterized protein n=1 Tax=Mycena albidolilacea TaxID=1033008 RepID=A0AAD6ZFU3_9AGAR|nr:hypothetical protein DFH08DRAFT_818777 [Mycena albidolilacea]